tara:strand:- start:12 stop:563 length:552 start_codon:yes stop_codon:yes gene_type:complete
MQKKVLSEIDLYYGEIITPKGFEIKRDTIKNSILDSLIKEKRISNNIKDYAYVDYQLGYSQPHQWLQDYVRDHFKVEYRRTLIPKLNWGNVYEYNQKSFSRNTVDPVDLRNAADYTFIYGVDVGQDSTGIVIEFDDNRRKGRTWHIPLNNNHFVMFPSINKYFITPNKSKQMNIFLTTTYEFI